jgi:hypothetical protein
LGKICDYISVRLTEKAKRGTPGFYIALIIFLCFAGTLLFLFFGSIVSLFTKTPRGGVDGLIEWILIILTPIIAAVTTPLWIFYLRRLYQRSDITAAISVILGPVVFYLIVYPLQGFLHVARPWTEFAEHVFFIAIMIGISVVYLVEAIVNNRLAHKNPKK